MQNSKHNVSYNNYLGRYLPACFVQQDEYLEKHNFHKSQLSRTNKYTYIYCLVIE